MILPDVDSKDFRTVFRQYVLTSASLLLCTCNAGFGRMDDDNNGDDAKLEAIMLGSIDNETEEKFLPHRYACIDVPSKEHKLLSFFVRRRNRQNVAPRVCSCIWHRQSKE